MQTPGRYEDLRHVDAARFRHRERDLAHARALRARSPHPGLVARMMARIRSGATARRPIALTYDLHELRGAVCRMGDGGSGRITVRQADGVWMAICEPHPGDPEPLAS